jgi:predicted secreted protein
MAAPQSIIAGREIVVAIPSGVPTPVNTVVAGGRSATLSLSAEGIDLTSRDSSNWNVGQPGLRSWTISASGLFVKTGALSGAGLTVVPNSLDMEGVKNVEVGFTSGTAQTANQTDGYWATFIGTRRVHTLVVECDEYDDETSPGGKALMTAYQTGVTIPVVTTLTSGTTITSTYRVTSIEKGAEYEGIATCTYSLESVIVPTFVTTGITATQLTIWNAFNQTQVSNRQTLFFGSSPVPSNERAGSTYYTGEAIPTAFNITVPYTGEMTLSAEWQGTGPLSSALVTAP